MTYRAHNNRKDILNIIQKYTVSGPQRMYEKKSDKASD